MKISTKKQIIASTFISLTLIVTSMFVVSRDVGAQLVKVGGPSSVYRKVGNNEGFRGILHVNVLDPAPPQVKKYVPGEVFPFVVDFQWGICNSKVVATFIKYSQPVLAAAGGSQPVPPLSEWQFLSGNHHFDNTGGGGEQAFFQYNWAGSISQFVAPETPGIYRIYFELLEVAPEDYHLSSEISSIFDKFPSRQNQDTFSVSGNEFDLTPFTLSRANKNTLVEAVTSGELNDVYEFRYNAYMQFEVLGGDQCSNIPDEQATVPQGQQRNADGTCSEIEDFTIRCSANAPEQAPGSNVTYSASALANTGNVKFTWYEGNSTSGTVLKIDKGTHTSLSKKYPSEGQFQVMVQGEDEGGNVTSCTAGVTIRTPGDDNINNGGDTGKNNGDDGDGNDNGDGGLINLSIDPILTNDTCKLVWETEGLIVSCNLIQINGNSSTPIATEGAVDVVPGKYKLNCLTADNTSIESEEVSCLLIGDIREI